MDNILATFNAYDQDDIDLYSNALGTRLVLLDMNTKLRNDQKYGNTYETVDDCLTKLREYFNQLQIDHNIKDI
jgi:hypothetical protein